MKKVKNLAATDHQNPGQDRQESFENESPLTQNEGGQPLNGRTALAEDGYFQRQTESVLGWIRGQDQYGKGIPLNYRNSASFKTLPGGILSVIFKVLLFCYIILKWQDMSNKKDWRLTIQDLISSFELLEYTHQFNKPLYQNISMGIQIMPSRPKQTAVAMAQAIQTTQAMKQNPPPGPPDQEMGGPGGEGPPPGGLRRRLASEDFNKIYEADVLKISTYVRLYGMFEKFDGINYSVYDSNVNENLFNWHVYDNIIQVNSHGQYELKFNLSDAVISGTDDSIKRMDLVESNYQLRANVAQVKRDAYVSCASNQFGTGCPSMLDNLGQATRNMKYWTANQLIVSQMDDLIKNKDQDKIHEFLNIYHKDHLKDVGQPYYQSQIDSLIQQIKVNTKAVLDKKIGALLGTEDPSQQALLLKYQLQQMLLDQTISGLISSLNSQHFKTEYGEHASQFTKNYINKLESNIKSIERIKAQQEGYQANYELFWKAIETLFKKYELNLILYDEVEKFRDWDENEFPYPFQDRKTIISEVIMNIGEELHDYAYHSQQISFKISDVCTEGFYTDQLLSILGSIQSLIVGTLNLIGFNIKSEPFKSNSQYDSKLLENLETCSDNSRFVKLKYAMVSTTDHLYHEYYEEGVITDRILTEFILKMDSYKSTSKRNSFGFLDFLGAIGGFRNALNMFFVSFGGYFSAKFQLVSIARTLFVRKKNKREFSYKNHDNFNYEGGVKTKNIEKLFTQIQISTLQVIYDTIMTSIFCCCLRYPSLGSKVGIHGLKRQPFMIRQRTLKKCRGQLTSELNIDKILKKVRDSYAMVTNLPQSQEFKPYLKFNKNNIVQLTDSGDENYKQNGDETVDEDENIGDGKVFMDDNEQYNYFNDTGNSSKFDQSVEDIRLQTNFPLAIKRSLVQGMPFSKQEKIEMMKIQPKQRNEMEPQIKRRNSGNSNREIFYLLDDDPTHTKSTKTEGQQVIYHDHHLNMEPAIVLTPRNIQGLEDKLGSWSSQTHRDERSRNPIQITTQKSNGLQKSNELFNLRNISSNRQGLPDQVVQEPDRGGHLIIVDQSQEQKSSGSNFDKQLKLLLEQDDKDVFQNEFDGNT